MKIIQSVHQLQNELERFRQDQKAIAFIPTMGALHGGHISLVGIGKKKKAKTVVSIFVNPTQFDNAEDLAAYPRTLEKDAALLAKSKCDILFAPSAEEIYPPGLQTEVRIDLKGLDQTMEGEFRPGHFAGMLQVVKRLLDLVQPDYLVMGQKDFQQFALVRFMIKKLKLPIDLIMGPTKREKDGLAMSSRNTRLTPDFRKRAAAIFKTLCYLRRNIFVKSPRLLQLDGMQQLANAGLRPEYVRLINGKNLKPLRSVKNTEQIVACVAAWAGNVRLIDNLILKGPSD